MIPRVLALTAWRHGLRHPWQVLLAALGVALGVAVVTAVDLTKASATRAFAKATETVVGRTTHHVVGGPQGVDERLYPELRRRLPAVQLAPVIEATVRSRGQDEVALRLLGVDPIAEAPFRGYWQAEGGDAPLPVGTLMARPSTALLSRTAADRLEVKPGQRLEIRVGGASAILEIVGLLDGADRWPALAGSDVLIVDIATAQEVLDMVGRLSRIDAIALRERDADALRELLPSDAELVGAAARAESIAGMTGAFHTNLQALSLMALLVGMFLIYNSQTFMVVQRRPQFGTLRALGVTRRELFRLVLGEAVLLGLLGTVAGITLGWLLAHELVGLVTRTINDLYFALAVGEVSLTAPSMVKGGLLGLGGSLAAAVVPAREAGRVEPRAALSRSDLEARAGGGAWRALQGGLVLAVAGGLVLALPIRSLMTGFTGLFLVLIGLALTTPALLRVLALGLGRAGIIARFFPARLAVRGVAAALSRTGVAAAALMLAVATTVGVGIMVASFRASVDDWLGHFLRADFYLSLPASTTAEAGTAMDLALARGIAALTDVRHVSHVRHVTLTAPEGMTQLAVFRLNPEARHGFQFIKQNNNEEIWSQFEEQDAVLVTESYAYMHQVAPGDQVWLRTDGGERPFTIIGVYRDYGSNRGVVALSRATYGRHWPRDRAVNGIGIYLKPGIDVDRLRAQVAALAGPARQVELVSNLAIRKASMAVFDRTFTITEVLRLLAGIIAFIGVFSALLAIQLERTRELGVLKAVGVTPAQLRGIVLGETAMVGTVAGLYALPVGTVLALLLIEVINRRSFGWGMDLTLDGGVFITGIAIALTAALLAGIYPAARMASIQPAEALRSE